LRGHWKLDEDESAGNALADASGNGNTGTFTGTPAWTTGRIAGSANLTSGSFLQVEPSASLNSPTAALSMGGWFYRDVNPTTDEYIAYRRNAARGSVVHLLQGAGGVLCFSINEDQVCDGTALPGRWHHVAGTWDGTTKRLYLNGVLRAVDATAGPIAFDNDHSLFLGSNQGGSLSFSGRLDDWRLYNRALSGAEVATLASPDAVDCTVAAAGVACDDADPCTVGERCQAGECSANGGTAVTCDVENRCACPGQRRALLIVGATPLSADDLAVRARLEASGLGVHAVLDLGARAVDARGKSLVVISESSLSSAITPELGSIATPVLTLEPSYLDELGMTAAAGAGHGVLEGANAQAQIAIVDAVSPLAAGKMGTLTVTSAPAKFGWGAPAASAAKVATVVGDASKALIFGYHAGAAMALGTAPAKRVGFFAAVGTTGVLNSDGRALFDAAVKWAMSTDALMVTGSAASASDNAVAARLEERGYAVAFKRLTAPGQAAASDAAGKQLIVISETVASTNLGTAYRSVAVPAIVMEPAGFDEMAMTAEGFGTSQGVVEAIAGETRISIVDGAHPMAAGLSGTVTVTDPAGKFSWGVPAAGAVTVASLAGDPTRAAIFGYLTTATMADGSQAPARRVGFFSADITPSRLTSHGWQLFDAAVAWATAAERRASLVVADASALNPSDVLLRNRLVRLGFATDALSDETVPAGGVAERAVVVVSETVSSGVIGGKLAGATHPVVLSEPALLDEMGMAGSWGRGQGEFVAQTQIQIVDAGHPLAAGLTGTITVTNSAQKLVWGLPTAQAARVATLFGQPARFGLFGYEAGQEMVVGTAPARRAFWFAGDTTGAALTASGLAIFDAVVKWASGPVNPCAGLANGSACNDGNACTTGEVCTEGACGGGAAAVCEDGNACSADSCEPATGCRYETGPVEGQECAGSGNVCAATYVCRSGVCAAEGTIACADNDPCTMDACVAAMGCTHAPAPTGSPCPDGNACNGAETCSAAGQCVAATPELCDDANACTSDTCNPAQGCVFTPVPDGAVGGACCAALVSGMPLPSAGLAFNENWEECRSAWRDTDGQEVGYHQDAAFASCTAEGGSRVVKVSDAGRPARSSWFDLIPLAGGNAYCLSVAIRWVGGPRPYVAIRRYDASMAPGATHRLVGGDEPTGLGGRQVPIDADSSGWRYYRSGFTLPSDTAFVDIELGSDRALNKPGQNASLFDHVQIAAGPCPDVSI
jgi:hypothetical protein